jgi:hypothetical protein
LPDGQYEVTEGEPSTIVPWLVDCDCVAAASDALDEGTNSSEDPSRPQSVPARASVETVLEPARSASTAFSACCSLL